MRVPRAESSCEALRNATLGATCSAQIDLAIERGSVTALIGANGAGKSTMLTIIGRLLDADSGRVEVGGLDVRVAKPKSSRRSSRSCAKRTTLWPGSRLSSS